MSKLFHDHRVFWRQFRDHYHTTGAIAPSSRFLARALVRFVGVDLSADLGNKNRASEKDVASFLPPSGPCRVLEVGPGTGSVTQHLVRRLRPSDTLDLVELNEQFVRRLNERFATDRAFVQVADRSRVLHQRLEDLPPSANYDVIVSGLPLNNFAVADVEHILDAFSSLLRPGGILSFFEYVAIRKARAIVSNKHEKRRLKGIAAALDRVLGPCEIQRDCVWRNLPPAWVHHAQLGLEKASS